MKLRLLLFISIFFQLGLLNAQENLSGSNKNRGTSIIESETKVVINKEMIDRFNNCETDGKLISWRDLVLGFSNQNLSDLYYAYLTSDMENQTLEDIRLALENRQSEHLNNSSITDDDLAWFNRVKQEVNSKLGMTGMVVQR